MHLVSVLSAMLIFASTANGFLSPATIPRCSLTATKPCNKDDSSAYFSSADSSNNGGIDPSTIMDMDIVLFSFKSDESSTLQLGAMQEDGTLAPLSAWTDEYAFGEAIEFVVDEEDRWMKELEFENIIIHSILGDDVISYGSRQVGGGKGPGNPHGEESELLYYVENKVIDENSIDIVMKPDLEVQW